MRSNSSKPSSDAGSQPIGEFLPLVGAQALRAYQALADAMPYINLRTVETTCGSWFSFEVNREGIFFFVCPFELAVLWPWTEL